MSVDSPYWFSKWVDSSAVLRLRRSRRISSALGFLGIFITSLAFLVPFAGFQLFGTEWLSAPTFFGGKIWMVDIAVALIGVNMMLAAMWLRRPVD